MDPKIVFTSEVGAEIWLGECWFVGDADRPFAVCNGCGGWCFDVRLTTAIESYR